jgi:lysozyme family protein
MIETIIDEVIRREGLKDTNNPNDSGGRTKYGISERWNPEEWRNGPPTLDRARQVYRQRYIEQVGFDKVQPTFLQEQLIDFGVNSGPQSALMHLQKILGVAQDGKMGPATLGTIALRDPIRLNNALVDDRVLMLVRIVQKRPKDLEYVFGWVTRALSFRQ